MISISENARSAARVDRLVIRLSDFCWSASTRIGPDDTRIQFARDDLVQRASATGSISSRRCHISLSWQHRNVLGTSPVDEEYQHPKRKT